MNRHKIDYELIDDDIQIAQIELDPEESVIAEARVMNQENDRISFECKVGCRTQPNQGLFDKVLDMGNRSLSGESIFMAHFTNIGTVKKTGQFCSPMSRQNHLQNYQNNILCQKDVFLSVALGTKVFIAFLKKPEPDFLVGKDLFFRN